MFFLKSIRRFTPQELVLHILLAWLSATAIEYLLLSAPLRDLSGLSAPSNMSMPRVVLLTCAATLLLCGLARFFDTTRAERWCLSGAFAALAIPALRTSFSFAFLVVCVLLMLLLVMFGLRGWDASPESILPPEKASKISVWITVGLSVCFFLFVTAWTVGRVYSFSTPTFDFGIFAQMFYHMKESGLPLTTVERDGLLSHFHVHMSPIYYLMLPFYRLFPTPAALQVMQAAVITSAVIPLWKIGKNHGLSGIQRTLICSVLLLYPAFSGAASYDIHENCFLPPLILWMFYGIDRKHTGVLAVSAFLTLTVKEDAAVYVAVIALWLIVKTVLQFKKGDLPTLITGFVMLAASLVWFFLVTDYLARIGDGVMTYRYENFIYDGSSSLLTVVKSVILCPMKAIYECVDSEKLGFIVLTLLPLLGLPLLTRRYERYILLIPYLLVNLMSDYPYQHDIFFQYTFGSTAFLLYLTVVNLAQVKVNWQRILPLTAAVAVSAACFGTVIVPKAVKYPINCVKYFEYYQSIRDTLAEIPKDASVSATTSYTTFLSQRDTLYDVRHSSKKHLLETEYVALSVSAESSYRKFSTNGGKNGFENLVKLLLKNGYEPYAELSDVLVIYRKKG